MAAEADSLQARLDALRPIFEAFDYERVECLGVPLFEAATQAGAGVLATEVCLLLCLTKSNLARPTELLAWARKGLQACSVDEAPLLHARLLLLQGHGLALLGQSAAALESLQRGRALMPPDAEPGVRRRLLTTAGLVYGVLDMPHQSLQLMQSALEVAVDEPSVSGRVRSFVNSLEASMQLADALAAPQPEAARQTLLDALLPLEKLQRLAQESRWLHAERAHALMAAGLFRRMGRTGEARALLLPLVNDPAPEEALRHPRIRLKLASELAAIEKAEGCVEQACFYVQLAMEAAREAEDPAAVTRQLLLGSELAEARGDLARALDLYKQYHAEVRNRERQALAERAAEVQATWAQQSVQLERDVLRARSVGLEASLAQATEASLKDPLTGLANRRALQDRFAEGPGSSPAAVALIDVDHFKRVNDGHSHLVGDAVLRQLARLLEPLLRERDCLGRYGGEEFMVLLTRVTPDEAAAACERLRIAVQNHDWAALAPGLAVTVSLGVAPWGLTDSFDAMIALADACLYEAKRNGRNQVVVARGEAR